MDSALKVQKVDFIGHTDFVNLGANYLEIRDDAPDEVLASVAAKIKALDGAINWYIGDFAVAVGRVRGSERMNLFLKEWGVSLSTATTARRVCELFQPSDRLDGLSYSHFVEIEAVCDTKEEMMYYLETAMKSGLSVAKMRALARTDAGEGANPTSSARKLDFHAIAGSIKFAAVNSPTDLPPADRETLKESAPRMVEWWRQLAEL